MYISYKLPSYVLVGNLYYISRLKKKIIIGDFSSSSFSTLPPLGIKCCIRSRYFIEEYDKNNSTIVKDWIFRPSIFILPKQVIIIFGTFLTNLWIHYVHVDNIVRCKLKLKFRRIWFSVTQERNLKNIIFEKFLHVILT